MAKLILDDITDAPGFDVTVNANMALIEAAIENTLSRDGTVPNQMEAPLDMNSFRINNLADGIDQQDAVTIAQLIQASIAGPVSIGALIDVDLTGINVDDILQWDGIQFLPVALVLPIQATETSLGIAEIATQAEVDAGVDDLRFVTPAKLNAFPAVNQATETVAGIAELATQGQTNSGTNDTTIVTPLKLRGNTATTGRRGVIELATQTEVNDGVDTERAVTPATLAATPSGAAAFSGAVVTRATFHQSGHSIAPFQFGPGVGADTGELAIPFTSETIDTGVADFGTEFHSTSINITRFTIPAGVSRIRLSGGARWDTFHQNASGMWHSRFIKNGSHSASIDPGMGDYQAALTGDFFGGFAPSGGIAFHNVSAILNVSPGDYFEMTTMTQGSDFGDLRLEAGTMWFAIEVFD